MTTIFKWILGLVVAIGLVLVATAVALPLIYDTDDLKAMMADEVRERTGRELRIDGALEFSVFPWIAVEVGQLSLGNAEGFSDRPLATVRQARVGVALVPLLRKQIAVDEVTLDGLNLSLERNSRGNSNWEFAAASAAEPSEPREPGATRFADRRIAGLNIQDASVTMEDRSAGTHYRLGDFSLETGPIGDGIPLPLVGSALLEDVAAGTSAQVGFSFTALIDPEQKRYRFDDLQLTIDPRMDGRDAVPVDISTPKVEADLAAGTLEMGQFNLAVSNLDINGSLSASGLPDRPAYRGKLVAGAFSPSKLLTDLAGESPDTSDPGALQSAALETSFSGSANSVDFPDLSVQLDQSRLQGTLSVHNFERPDLKFDLAADRLDLDRYLPPTDPDNPAGATELPADTLKAHRVQGTLRAGDLKMAGLSFSDAEVGISLKDGVLRLHPLKAGFYGGTYDGNVVLDSSRGTPVLTLNESIDSVTLQRLVADLVDSNRLSGLAKGYLRVNATGNTDQEILNNLNGELGLSLGEGALEGINVWQEIRKGMAAYKGLAPPPEAPDRTVFSRMQVDAGITDGKASTRQLVAELPFLTLSGSGDVHLGKSTVDLRLVAAVHNMPELADDPLTADLRGRKLPFRLTGSLDNPQVKLDFKSLLTSGATGILSDKLGLGKSTRPEDSPSESTDAPAESSTQEADDSAGESTEEAAVNTLFKMLQGSKKKTADGEEKDEGGS